MVSKSWKLCFWLNLKQNSMKQNCTRWKGSEMNFFTNLIEENLFACENVMESFIKCEKKEDETLKVINHTWWWMMDLRLCRCELSPSRPLSRPIGLQTTTTKKCPSPKTCKWFHWEIFYRFFSKRYCDSLQTLLWLRFSEIIEARSKITSKLFE